MPRISPPRKISARFSGETARRLRELERRWKASTSEVLARAVTEAAEREEQGRALKPDAWDILMESGVVGSIADGRTDASVTYKTDVAEHIAAKHGHR